MLTCGSQARRRPQPTARPHRPQSLKCRLGLRNLANAPQPPSSTALAHPLNRAAQECFLAFSGNACSALTKRAVFTGSSAIPLDDGQGAIEEDAVFLQPAPAPGQRWSVAGGGDGDGDGTSWRAQNAWGKAKVVGKLAGTSARMSVGNGAGDSPPRTRAPRMSDAGPQPSPNPRMLKKRPSLITIVRSKEIALQAPTGRRRC